MIDVATFWDAEISMLMPASHAERNALVEFLQTGSSRRGVHGADQFVSVLGFLIEQRRGAGGIEGEAFQVSVPVVREVIHWLRKVRREDVKAIGQGGAIVLIFLDGGSQGIRDFVGAAAILIGGGALRCHAHVGAIHVMVMSHRLHRAGLGMVILVVVHIHAGHAAVVLMLVTFFTIVLRSGLLRAFVGGLRLPVANRRAKQQRN